MGFVTIKTSNLVSIDANDVALVSGKNGSISRLGHIPILVTDASLVSEDSNIQLSISTLDNLFDDNFTNNVLEVNDGFYLGLKGSDFISVPISEKDNSGSEQGFVGHNPILTRYSANVLTHDLSNGTVTIENETNDSQDLFSKLESTPFYASLGQILDPAFFTAKTIFLEGTNKLVEKTFNLSSVGSGTYTANVGVPVRRKKFITAYVDGQQLSQSDLLNFTQEEYTFDITLDGTESQLRTVVDYYTVPAIEPGDNVSVISGNLYAIANTSYNAEDPSYNVALTSNHIYKVTLASAITSNLSGVSSINITPDLTGTVANVNTSANTFTVDYDESSYPYTFNLANNKIYQVNISTGFKRLSLGKEKIIRNAPSGPNVVRARNVNTMGRRSPFVTKSASVSSLPIRKVINLSIVESLYKDTTQGIGVRVTVSFDHITGQEVTDYEISYKLSTGGTDLESFNTVKIPASGVDSDGKIRYTINNVDRGRTTSVNSITVQVVPLNKNLRGVPAVKTKNIIGKSAKPENVLNVAGGQQNQSIVFSWGFSTNVEGDLTDIDLLETIMKRVPSEIVSTEYANNWVLAEPYESIATPATSLLKQINRYGTFTYLFRTKDTSGLLSSSVKGITLTTVRPTDLQVYKTWSDDDPSGNVVSGFPNENSSETNYISITSNDGGLSVPGGSAVDNANGTSTGFSVIGGSPTDLSATGNAFYQTQVRDAGAIVTGSLLVTANGVVTSSLTFNDLRDTILTGVTEVSSAANVLVETDFGGIGHLLGFNNSNAATVSYNSNSGTLISGGATGNVYAIWNPGQFTGDVSNSNSYALIAGVINTNAIALGETFFANGVTSSGNSLSNLVTIASSYELVDLQQFVDETGSITFLGNPNIITTNLEARYATQNVFYANSNVNSAAFIGGTNNEGWRAYSSAEREFRYYQVKFTVANENPNEGDYVLDKLNMTIDLKDKSFSDDISIISSPQEIDYSSAKFIESPNITLTMLSDGDYSAVVVNRSNAAANVNVYQSGSTVTGVDLNVRVEGI